MRAAPPSDMMARTSAKSRLIKPGTVISSEIPWMPWRRTSSAVRKDSCRVARLSTIWSRRSLGITIKVSACSFIRLMPSSADADRLAPSNVKGRVTTPMVRAPTSLAICETMGAAPVPVPPPRPAVTNTISLPRRTSYSSSADSSAALRPISGLPPAPRPRVALSPIRTRTDALESIKAWASVFTATNSMPCRPSSIIRFTALQPPPPTPITLIRANDSG